MQREDRQIIGRSLDTDFPLGRSLCPAIFRAVSVSQDRLDGLQVQWRAAAVSQALKHLVEMATDREDQVATVFYLIARVLIAKADALLLVDVERVARRCRSNARRPGSIAL